MNARAPAKVSYPPAATARTNYSMMKYVLPFCCIVFAGACQSPATSEEPPVHANLYVRYLESDGELRGQASFFRGDSLETAVPLQLPGGVSFMSSGMKMRELPGKVYRYSASLPVSFRGPFRFAYRLRPDEEPRILSIDMAPIDSFRVLRAGLEDGLAFDLYGSLNEEEELLLLFTDEAQQVKTVLVTGPHAPGELRVPADALVGFRPGPYQLYLVKKLNRTAEAEDGTLIHQAIEYYTAEVGFKLR